MPDAVGVAIVNGLMNRSCAVGFASVDGRIEVVFSDKGKGFGVFFGGVIDFATGQVESDDAFILEGNGELGES